MRPRAALAVLLPGAADGCAALDLEISRIEPPPSQYAAFCGRRPEACRLSGEGLLDWDAETEALVARINRTVNAEIELVPDADCRGREEHWSFPADSIGDCEDFALEKRRRLVA